MQFAQGILTHTPLWVFALLAAIIGRAISGATAGYFIGSTIALLRAYWRKRQQDAAI